MRPRRSFGLAFMAFLALSFSTASPAQSPLRISSFNIQVLGPSKASNPFVIETLAQILSRYDMTFVQEIRDSNTTAIDTLLAALNADRARPYALALSERLGRTVSKEQYAFIYDPDRIELLSVQTYADESDQFEREPYIGRFRSGQLDFSLVGIHVTPRAVAEELQALNEVYRAVTLKWQDRDVLIMGDLNADCSYYNASLGFDFFDEQPLELLPPGTDTTVAPAVCTYDRVLAFGAIAGQLSGGQAYNFQQAFGFSLEEARLISDHYPIEFKLEEDRGTGSAAAEIKDKPPHPPLPDLSERPKSCGIKPYQTPKGYCFASFEQGKRRVAGSCCF